jgi:hypothetical protein
MNKSLIFNILNGNYFLYYVSMEVRAFLCTQTSIRYTQGIRVSYKFIQPSISTILLRKKKFLSPMELLSMLGGSLSPQHGASSGCGWRNGLQLWRLAANILNKQSRTDNKGWSFSLVEHEMGGTCSTNGREEERL